MRRLSKWLSSHPVFASLLAVVAVALLLFVFSSSLRITKGNFAKITIGMSQEDIYELLGKPQFDQWESGFVGGPTAYSTTHYADEWGSKHYRRQEWRSLEFAITVILDPEQRVVCRYSYVPRHQSWLDYIRWRFSGLF